MRQAIFFLIIVCTLLVAFTGGGTYYDRVWSVDPSAKQGQLHAAILGDHGESSVRLKGEWEYYNNQLLTPLDFIDGQPRQDVSYLHVPSGWREEITGVASGEYEFGTYRLQVLLDGPVDEVFAFRLDRVRQASRIFINGQDFGGVGKLSMQVTDFQQSRMPFLAFVDLEQPQVDIIIQVANHGYLPGGMVQAPLLGEYASVLAGRELSALSNVFFVAVMSAFALFSLVLFWKWREDRHLLLFSLFCLLLSLYVCLEDETMMTWFPQTSFALQSRLIYTLGLMILLVYFHYVTSFFSHSLKMRHQRWLFILLYAGVLVCLLTPPVYLPKIFWPYALLVSTMVGYLIVLLLVLGRRGLPGWTHLYVGAVFLGSNYLIYGYKYIFFDDVRYLSAVATLMLIISQAMLISSRFRMDFLRIRRLSDQLIEHDRRKDEFLAMTSHELRTPLHGIINLSQSMLEDKQDPLSWRQQERLQLMHGVSRRLGGLVQDILDISRIKYGQFRLNKGPTDIRTVAELVFDMLAISSLVNRQVVLYHKFPEQMPLVYADQERLRQVLFNLLENACKFTEEGEIVLEVQQHERELELSVADTGIGIPPNKQRLIFQPYQSLSTRRERPESGSGLGLSITRQLVELHGSQLRVESESGAGARFSFRLPVYEQTKDEVAVATDHAVTMPPTASVSDEMHDIEVEEKQTIGHVSVLVADDEPANRKILVDAMTSLGFEVYAAHHGRHALEMLARQSFDLVLLDLMMPHVTGLDVCADIRRSHTMSELPVLMITASGQVSDVLAAFEAGANDIVQKPFELAELRARVQSLLAMKHSTELAVQRELDYLQGQIAPHFLYNSLNALIGLTYKNPDKVREMIRHLATYLRAKFSFFESGQLITLQQELELIRAYLAIEQLRFGARLKIVYELPEQVHILIPPLTLQPLVENAVRHGIGPQVEGGQVRIFGYYEEGWLHLGVEDDGVGMSPEQMRDNFVGLGNRGGVGIRNVRKRLQMVYGQDVYGDSQSGHGTKVCFKIKGENWRAESDTGR